MKKILNIIVFFSNIYCVVGNIIFGFKNANFFQIILGLIFALLLFVTHISTKILKENNDLYEEMYRMKTNEFLFLYKAVKNKMEEDKRYTHLVLGINKYIVNLVDLKEKYDNNN